MRNHTDLPTPTAEAVQKLNESCELRVIHRAGSAGRPPALVIYALMSYDFLELYPINPNALARYREAFTCESARTRP